MERVASRGEAALYRGLTAVKLGEYGEARERLSAVAAACPASPLGSQALLILVALELDPRNPERDPRRARDLAEGYFAAPRKPAWTEPAMESLYLLAVELGAVSDSTVAGPAGLPRGDSLLAVADSVAAVADSLAAASGAADSVAPEVGFPAPDSLHAVPEDPPAEVADSGTAEEPAGAGRSPDSTRAGDAVASADTALSLKADGGLSCGSTRPGPFLGVLRPPELPGSPLMERVTTLLAERAALRENASRLERRLAELQQELERIRATLSP